MKHTQFHSFFIGQNKILVKLLFNPFPLEPGHKVVGNVTTGLSIFQESAKPINGQRISEISFSAAAAASTVSSTAQRILTVICWPFE